MASSCGFSAAQTEVAAARQDGKVYAVIPVRMVANTQPVVGVSVNGGSSATLLVDSGASGLVTTADKVGTLGTPTGSGESCFSGGLCYHYETYDATVDLGGGAVTTAPVNIVTNNDEYPDSVADFKEFFAWGADGILGTGAKLYMTPRTYFNAAAIASFAESSGTLSFVAGFGFDF